MGRQIGLVTAVLVLLGAGNVRATIIELPLDCAGTYNRSNYDWEIYFDCGVEFTQISHVYIDWEGDMTAALVEFSDNPNNPVPVDVGITAIIGQQPPWRYTYVLRGKSTYPNPENFDIVSEFAKGTMSWSELYDGRGSIRITYSEEAYLNGIYIIGGTVNLDNAKLIIEGDVVPEPITVLFLMIGTFGLRFRRIKKLA